MSLRGFALMLSGAVVVLSIIASKAEAIPSWNKPCVKAYRDWQKKPRHKAFALSSGGGQGQNCGYSWGAGSKEIAERDALAGCRKGKWGIKSTCYIVESE